MIAIVFVIHQNCFQRHFINRISWKKIGQHVAFKAHRIHSQSDHILDKIALSRNSKHQNIDIKKNTRQTLSNSTIDSKASAKLDTTRNYTKKSRYAPSETTRRELLNIERSLSRSAILGARAPLQRAHCLFIVVKPIIECLRQAFEAPEQDYKERSSFWENERFNLSRPIEVGSAPKMTTPHNFTALSCGDYLSKRTNPLAWELEECAHKSCKRCWIYLFLFILRDSILFR